MRLGEMLEDEHLKMFGVKEISGGVHTGLVCCGRWGQDWPETWVCYSVEDTRFLADSISLVI